MYIYIVIITKHEGFFSHPANGCRPTLFSLSQLNGLSFASNNFSLSSKQVQKTYQKHSKNRVHSPFAVKFSHYTKELEL